MAEASSMPAATLGSLPPELLAEILLKLDTRDRVRLGSVNSALWRQGRDPAVWATLEIHQSAKTYRKAELDFLTEAKFESLLRFVEARGKGALDRFACGTVCTSPGSGTPARDTCEQGKAPSFAGRAISCVDYSTCGEPRPQLARDGVWALNGLARLLRLLPALQTLDLYLGSFSQLGPGVLTACSSALASFQLAMDGCEEDLTDWAGSLALKWMAPELASLPALTEVTLQWLDTRWAWGFWQPVTALCKATALTSLCLLNSYIDPEEREPWDPALREGVWGPELSLLRCLHEYTDNLGLGLPRQVAELTRLTSLVLQSFTWRRQGLGLCAARHLLHLQLGNLFPPEVDDAREVSHGAVQRVLNSVTHLRWDVEPCARALQSAFVLPRVVTLETRGSGIHFFQHTAWLPAGRLRHLLLLDPGRLPHLDLGRLSGLTTLQYLLVRGHPFDRVSVGLPGRPCLAHVRVVKLQGVTLKCVPPELQSASCLEVLDLRGSPALQLAGPEVDWLLGLCRLRLVWLCKRFEFCFDAYFRSPCMSDDVDSDQAWGGQGCAWNEASLRQLARLRAGCRGSPRHTPGSKTDTQACAGCGGPFRL